jgi:hypothetical protein
MKCLHYRLERPVAVCLVVLFFAPTLALASPKTSAPGEGYSLSSINIQQDSAQSGAADHTQQSSASAQSAGAKQTPSPAPATNPQTASAAQTTQSEPNPSVPGGTAVAPYEKQVGITASEPAGAAIAPGKQRRIRTFAVRAALLIGAAVAIGVVVAASEGSPSRP